MFDILSKHIRAKLRTFDESGMGYWLVTAKLRDGRTFTNVTITETFGFGFPDLTPFKLKDVVDVEWDGYRGSRSSAQPVEIATGDHHASHS